MNNNSVAVISIRRTTQNSVSRPANFYAAMVPAKGKLQISDTEKFRFELVANPRAAVHVGWQLYAVVNDKGTNTGNVPDKAFNEADYTNNTNSTGIKNFNVSINPSDTAIARLGNAQLTTSVSGGVLSSYLWKQDPFISCINCLIPVVSPTYTKEYMFIAHNEYACIVLHLRSTGIRCWSCPVSMPNPIAIG